ncbi:MAG: hypothetical protein HQK87_11150 [Nitrospinae bacterium]|nr:hypothetical protein [Nitrospinota bacterium]
MSALVHRRKGTKKEPRRLTISRLQAIRSGLLLANGEVWTGTERRCDRLLTGACTETERETMVSPPDFFG